MSEIKKVVVSSDGDVTRYAFFWRPCGYAFVYVDHVYGVLSVYSDLGSWSHAWPNGKACWGTDRFEDFLRDISGVDYLVGKLMSKEERREFDAERTCVEMSKEVRRDLEGGILSEDEASKRIVSIRAFCESADCDGLLVAATSEVGDDIGRWFPCFGEEWIWWKESVAATALREQILVPFVLYLTDKDRA